MHKIYDQIIFQCYTYKCNEFLKETGIAQEVLKPLLSLAGLQVGGIDLLQLVSNSYSLLIAFMLNGQTEYISDQMC